MTTKEIMTRVLGPGLLLLAMASTQAASVTGDPVADAWTAGGNSLANGVYVTGSANYAFDTYSAAFAVDSGSNLEISDGANSWLAGDNVVAVGGKFQTITAADAGWAAITGQSINSLLPAGGNPSTLKLQAKFGTSAATWTTSTTAPGSGNGDSSGSSGGGRVQVKTSAYFGATVVTAGQDEPWTWAGNSGQLLVLDKPGHLDWAGISPDPQPGKYAARMIWIYDPVGGHVTSWELLLNTSLLDRLVPGHLVPAAGDKVILTVQNGDGAYTDALVQVVPVPPALWLFGSAVALLGWLRRQPRGLARRQ